MKFNIKKSETIGIIISGIVSIAYGIFSQIVTNNTIDELVEQKLQEKEDTTEETEEEQA